MLKILRHDPSSAVSASIAGWKHPISREALALYDQFDLEHQVAAGGKRVKARSGRPWESDDTSRERKGNAAGRSMAQIRDILNAHGHALPV